MVKKFALLPAVLLMACASPPQSVAVMPGPPLWNEDIDYSEPDCADIEGAFQNLGEHSDGRGPITHDGLLAEKVFARRLPRSQTVQTVKVRSSIEAGWLQATLVGAISLKIGFAVSCQSGWHVLVETRSRQYAGGGVEQENFKQMSYFRLDRKGRLVARVLSSDTYRTENQDDSQETSENWYRFEPAPTDPE